VKKFLIALQFLTILPIKIKSEIEERDFGASLIYFPIVGAIIGLLLIIVLVIFDFLPHIVKIALILTTSIFITGGIHLDGFADTCDGFYGAKSKEEILKIMRDSRIGTMGVVGVVCLLLLKFSILASLPKEILWETLITTVTFARWAQVLGCYLSRYARQEGKARYFIEYAGLKEILLGTFFTLMAFFILLQVKGVILFFVSTLPIFLCINYVKRRVGGMTGDTIGATSEIAEVSMLFFVLAFASIWN
jgi:adenosylcobinamide-GDP ribazoletransferase